MQGDHLARANAPSSFDFEHVGDSERARLTTRSASPPGVRQLVKLGIFELGQLGWRWNDGHDLLKGTECILDGTRIRAQATPRTLCSTRHDHYLHN
jgi:hypothetical protein